MNTFLEKLEELVKEDVKREIECTSARFSRVYIENVTHDRLERLAQKVFDAFKNSP